MLGFHLLPQLPVLPYLPEVSIVVFMEPPLPVTLSWQTSGIPTKHIVHKQMLKYFSGLNF